MMHGDIRGLGMRKQLRSHQGLQTDHTLRAGCKVWFFLRFSFPLGRAASFIPSIECMLSLVGFLLPWDPSVWMFWGCRRENINDSESSVTSAQKLTLWQSGMFREPTVTELLEMHPQRTFNLEPWILERWVRAVISNTWITDHWD